MTGYNQLTPFTDKPKKLSLIQVPFGLGAGRPGSELGPESMLQSGLIRQIRNLGLELAADHQVDCPDHKVPSSGKAKVKYISEVKEMSGLVAEQVSQAAAGQTFPLVLGGDHSVSVGVVAGLTSHFSNLGLIWFDAHGGLHTEETTSTGKMNEMSLAAILGEGGSQLADMSGIDAPIKKEHLVIIGTRELDSCERELIRSKGITCYSMHDIDRMGIQNVIEKALQIAGNGTDGIHLSFDADCLDPLEAPGVGSPVLGGLSYREAHFALELLAESGRITSMDVVEINALLDVDRRTARLAVGLIASLLGKRIL
ncbi:arginase [Paenibacillus sp. yr247]|uniref:arginase n=1 Tax=Paenibacillus sp. yr247 TaxID=1761880 RepID=UPI0008860D6B|nr:arginase [Paenibacillus sp. yr247]SDN23898.1 arginase [Paenibacillus sp. yr247]